MNFSIVECHHYHDCRGNLIEFINENFLLENSLPFGQIYLVTFENRNTIRGNHYHRRSSEAFCVINGEVEIVLEDVESKERFSHIFRAGDVPVYRLIIGPKVAHAIRSLTNFAIVVSYSSKIYDPSDEDKFSYVLL